MTTGHDRLAAAAVVYAELERTNQAAHTAAVAASARYTAARNGPRDTRDDAHAAMGRAWRRADRTMRAAWQARDTLCAAALALDERGEVKSE